MRFVWLFLITLVLPFSLQAAAKTITVEAGFQQKRFPVNRSGTYQIIVKGTQVAPEGQLPAPEGLRFQSVGKSSSVQYINGKSSVTVTYSFAARAEQPGQYSIPQYTITIAGQNFTIPATTVTVTEADQPQITDDGTQSIWLEYELPEGNLYVGQAIPVKISLLVHSQLLTANAPLRLVDFDPQPNKTGDAYQLENYEALNLAAVQRGLQNPLYYDHDNEMIDGKPYKRVTWESLLVPLKSGTQPLQFSINTVLENAEQERDPFPGLGSFFRTGRRERVPLHTEPRELTIRPLPLAGKPTGFGGAIGEFRLLQPTLDRETAKVGEPLLLTVQVEGSGNFDRIEAPRLEKDSGWQVRPDNDTAFDKSDRIGLVGTKTFRYTLIPGRETLEETPIVNFSFLEPQSGAYATLRSEPIAVDIAPAPMGALRYVRGVTNEKPDEVIAPTVPPLQNNLGTLAPSIAPPFTQPVFIALNSFMLIASTTLFFFLRHRDKAKNDAAYRRRKHFTKLAQKHLNAAMTANDAASFYENATGAIQSAAALHIQKEAGAIDERDVTALLQDEEASDFFKQHETIQYSGKAQITFDKQAEQMRLKSIVKKLERKRPILA